MIHGFIITGVFVVRVFGADDKKCQLHKYVI